MCRNKKETDDKSVYINGQFALTQCNVRVSCCTDKFTYIENLLFPLWIKKGHIRW